MNAIAKAFAALDAHLSIATASQKDEAVLAKELMAMKKEDLVAMLIKTIKLDKVKVEDVVKPILADPVCSWLSMEDIAQAVAERLGSNTSHKSIASYASKYPKEKGWVVVPRKSNSERMSALKELMTHK
jgi:hypothetical protein